MNADTESVIMSFHEYVPKDRLHAELFALRDEWNEAPYLFKYFDDPERVNVFANLRRRMCWDF